MEHALFSPSSAKRWVNCTGSMLLPEDGLEEDQTAAKEGSLAHKIAETKLKRLKQGLWFVDEYILDECRNNELYTPEMDEATDTYVSLVEQVEGDMEIEHPIVIRDDLFGTCDCIVFNEKEITIFDFKYGRVEISAKENEQLMLYAYGAIKEYRERYPLRNVKDLKINLVIFQPRIGNLDSWTTDYESLSCWFTDCVQSARYKIKSGFVECHTGNWCRWCNRSLHCRRFNEMLLKDVLEEDEITNNLERLKLVERQLKKIREYTVKRIESGEDVKGYKLTYSKLRYWNKSEVLESLADEYGLWDLISPAKAEKKVGKNEFKLLFSDFVETKQSAPKLQKVKS